MNKFGQTFEEISGIFGKLIERKTMKVELRITAGLKNKIKTDINRKLKEDQNLLQSDACVHLAHLVVEALENKEKILSLS